jgi:hypothetical protein
MISKGFPFVERTTARNEAGFRGGGPRPANGFLEEMAEVDMEFLRIAEVRALV